MKLPKLPKFDQKIAKFSDVNLSVHNRKFVLVASREKFEEISKQWDWKADLPHLIPGYSSGYLLNEIGKSFKTGKLKYAWYKTKKLPTSFEINQARNKFSFPVNHPIDGLIYCSTELEPDLYLPISGFHDYMYQAKMSAFIDLCSSLNAKEVRVIYAEENGKNITSKVAGAIPTQQGMVEPDINFSYNQGNTIDSSIFYSFPKSSVPIKEYDKPWLNSEPSWVSLQKIRLERDVTRSTAEFSYSDEMGVTSKIVGKMNKLGVDIGGTYSEIKKRSFKFSVEFWPKE